MLSLYFEFITTDCALEPDHSLIIICIMFTKNSKFVCCKGKEKMLVLGLLCVSLLFCDCIELYLLILIYSVVILLLTPMTCC